VSESAYIWHIKDRDMKSVNVATKTHLIDP
jgi:hypothetical protein